MGWAGRAQQGQVAGSKSSGFTSQLHCCMTLNNDLTSLSLGLFLCKNSKVSVRSSVGRMYELMGRKRAQPGGCRIGLGKWWLGWVFCLLCLWSPPRCSDGSRYLPSAVELPGPRGPQLVRENQDPRNRGDGLKA